ncbi:MAG: type II secretion system F family protein [Acidimicrobiales bacterium]
MNGATLLAAGSVGLGLALLGVGVLSLLRRRAEDLSAILDLPYGERDVDVVAISETRTPLVADTVAFAGRMVDQFDAKGSLQERLERAKVPLRTGEFVVLVIAGAVIGAVFLIAITDRVVFGLAAFVAAPFLAKVFLGRRIAKRRRAFEEQLPETLSIIASSLSAGHTFLRSIQMMCEEAEPPMSEEFARVVSETRLGDPLVDALERMAARLDIDDLSWTVQAIKIQQQVGGKLADLLHTLADFMRDREEIKREIDVLTAEGRISAWVLGALPVFLMLAIQVMSPGYMDPLFQGWGIPVLAGTAISVIMGVVVIKRMVEIDV